MKLKQFILCTTFLLAGAGAGIASAQELKMGDELPRDPAVRIGKLDNGMTYFLRHNETPKGMVDFYIVYNVGSIQEEDNQTGLAHFLEHMMFNGTKHFPGDSMIRWLEGIGLQFGTNLNAATGMEMTFYQLTQVPLKRETLTDSLLLVLHDWSGFLSLEKKEIDKERGVIIEELRQRNTPQFRIGNKAAPFVYGDTRYAHRDMLGSEEFLKTFRPQLLRDYYKRWYRPDLQAIVIVGDFDVDAMEAKLKKKMADIPKANNPEPKAVIRIPDNEQPIVAIVTDPEQYTCNANFYIKRPAAPQALNNRVGTNYMNMLINVLVAMTNIRLGELVQQEGCPFARAGLLNSSLTTTCDAMELQVVARGNMIAEAFTSIYGELERIRRFGFTQEELDFVRMSILRAGKHTFETAGEQNNGVLAQTYIDHYVKNIPLLTSDYQWAFTQLMMRQMKLDETNALMSNLLSLSNNVLVLSVPEKEKAALPDEKALAGFLAWIRSAEIEPYQRKTLDKPLLSESITPGKVTKTESGLYGSTVWTLNNGIRVVALPTAHSRNRVVMSAQADGGLSTLPMQDYFTGSMTAQIAIASGANGFTNEELRLVLGTKSASVLPVISRFFTGVSGSAAKADVETMLQLTYLYFMHPAFDRGQFDQLLEANRMNLANSANAPEFKMNQWMNRLKYGDNPRTQIPDEETLKSIDFSKIPQLYRHFFTDAAGNYTFYLLGDMDLEVLKPLVEMYLGGLPAGNVQLAWKDDGVRILPGVKEEQKEIPMQTAKSLINFTYSGELAYTRQNQLLLRMLSACLQSRYMQMIREEKGGAYSINVNGLLYPQPVPAYELNISFQTDPAKVDELVKIVKDELLYIADKGPDADDLNKNLEYARKEQPESLKDNQTWLTFLQNYYMWGEDWHTDAEKLLKTVTSDNLRKLARKIVNDGNMKQVILSPLEKK